MLREKKILLGITGGIAAYKTTFLVRLLIKAGADVRVILTDSASSFVSSLTLATLSKNEVVINFIKTEGNTTNWNNHVALGLWADLMIIAPATANTMAKMVSGTCDSILLATYLSAKCPVYFAPAMDLDMFKHPSTQKSLMALQSYGNHMIPATSGELASGLHGEGRMAEPEAIINFIGTTIAIGLPLRNKTVLITAGPTHEAIDPVRFIGNHATGLMGFELANRAARLGARVILISGPTHLNVIDESITLVRVTTAEEMYNQSHAYFAKATIVICAAAVADYKPQNIGLHKIKKSSATLDIILERTKDILQSLGEIKANQYLVGFALETENEEENAIGKLKRKNLDAIVLNSLNDEGAGFGGTTNKIKFIDANLAIQTFELKTKAAVATDIFNEIIKRYDA